MPTIFNEIIRNRARKLAEAHIKRALNDLQYGGQFNFEDCQRDIRNSYWQRKSVNFVFDRAYDGPWYLLGGDDALKGRRRFDVPAYLEGWRGQILSLAYNGWVNPRVVQQYGWIDEVIGQQYINTKHQLDQLDWGSAPYDKRNRAG
ncbi:MULTISPECIES: hypothetical protein [Pseudomonas]|jgi:hypothetical protein|uniref:Uncharacterized protein n=1 Tax=Pseudomonas putida (strain ATCC 47054 / DSM 6125 / CFBP 8728 / NCIMB 11950 / KT2440) TaxID=160488 RepID=A0A140FW13_PSEPK|nr:MULTISPECIES: hypothetical protein [Pseudomonas]AMM02796.1 protein of unknown function [Pseudomonas putida KT2440]KMU92875.1 hypothetical protein AC138_27580 [Pseudomonas putida]KMY37360.1 hypothetical protein AA993_05845 [Pseudomonas putida]MDD2078530.1 hypothetical protein [Pseudomonas putida]PXZ54288.1 hypothetical protein DM483_02480 [Pseudomonas sp. SMT-1]